MSLTDVVCKYCGFSAVSKYGSYHGTPLYWCKVCRRKFKADSALFGMRTPAERVAHALNDHYEGQSLNSIMRSFESHDGYDVSDVAIKKWVDRFAKAAVATTKDLHPSVGSTWVADETVLKIGGQNVWLWDVIDSDTRFLLATRLSPTRTTRDAQILMDRALAKAGKPPKVVVTDKLGSYLDVNYGKGAEHEQGGPFSIESSTSLIERFHGTLKDRTKVMRGLKSLEAAHEFLDGWLVHYNFIRPHSGIGDQTPAEAAGIERPFTNWVDVVRVAETTVQPRWTAKSKRKGSTQGHPPQTTLGRIGK